MRRVYIINKGPHDYKLAEPFGELFFCTDGSLDRSNIAQMHRVLTEALADSDPDDLLLLTSLTSLCSVACAIFATMHGELHLLIHRGSRKEGYFERSLVFDN